MNQNIEIALKQAFNLIEADQLEDARAILRPILESEKDNADVWWVYAHAVTDVDTARLALNNVLRLDSNYPGARELFDQVYPESSTDDLDGINDIGGEPSFMPALPTSIPGISPLPKIRPLSAQAGEDYEEFPDEDIDTEADDAFYRSPLFYVPLISLLVIVALAVVIFKPFSVSSPTITAVVDATAETVFDLTPTVEISIGLATSATVVDATVEGVVDLPPTVDIGIAATSTIIEATLPSDTVPTVTNADVPPETDFSDVELVMSDFNLASESPTTIENTSIGSALVSTVCTTAGREMRILLPQVTIALAKVSESYSDQVDAIAVRMSDCTTNTTLLQVGVPIDDAVAFATEAVTEQDFQSLWKPV